MSLRSVVAKNVVLRMVGVMTVTGAALVVAVERDDLGPVVDVEDVAVLPLQAAGGGEPVAAQMDEVAVELQDPRVRGGVVPVELGRVLRPDIQTALPSLNSGHQVPDGDP